MANGKLTRVNKDTESITERIQREAAAAATMMVEKRMNTVKDLPPGVYLPMSAKPNLINTKKDNLKGWLAASPEIMRRSEVDLRIPSNQSPCIVSISGMIGAGKDTMVAHLMEKYGFVKGSFSRALKDAVAVIFGWDRALLEGDTKEGREWRERVDPWWDRELDGLTDEPITPRWVLQYFGTPIMRDQFHKDIWVLAVKKWLADNQDKRIVFSDTRFLNEFQMIHTLGAVTLGIYRDVPKWLGAFYQVMDERIYQRTGLLFTQVNTGDQDGRELLADTANHLNTYLHMYTSKAPNLHPSDVEHLVWSHYAGVIDNRGSIADSQLQLEKILKGKGIL